MTDTAPTMDQVRDQMKVWELTAGSGSFEESMDALEAIVALLDRGELTLDLSVQCFELGTRLSERCQQLLEAAELRVSLLSPAGRSDEENDGDPWVDEPEQ